MKPFHHVLAVIDDPSLDMRVVERAIALTDVGSAHIELFQCVYDDVIAAERAFSSADLGPAKDRLLQEHERKLAPLEAHLRDLGYETTTTVVWDKPVFQGIVRHVLKTTPDIVIRNSRYHTPTQRASLSNDDWSLMRTCPAPLLIVRRDGALSSAPRIWASVDPMHDHDKPAALDDTIVDLGQQFASALGGELSLVHTYDPAPALAGIVNRSMGSQVLDLDDITEQVRVEHVAAVDRVAEKHGIPQDRVLLVQGPAKRVIPALAIEQNAEIIVMGCVARGRIALSVLGNTAEVILTNTPSDVLIVKPDRFETPIRERGHHRLVL
ncbi:MAG: universal stress protein [Pseudomonadota bacterium]